MQRFVDFISAKRGLAAALHSGHAAYGPCPTISTTGCDPPMRMLLSAAEAAGEVRPEVDPDDLLTAVASLCGPRPGTDSEHPRRMVALLVDGSARGNAGRRHPSRLSATGHSRRADSKSARQPGG